MKKAFLLLFILIFSYNMNATNHIKFLDIELTGNYNDFKDSLRKKGFKYVSSFLHSYNFRGKIKHEPVYLTVMSTPKTNIVCKVIIYFSVRKKWKDLRNDYVSKTKLFSDLYPIDTDYNFFLDSYEDGDGYEMKVVAKDKCRYISFFLAVGGHITVEIDKSARIKVVFEDRDNIKLAQNELGIDN